MAVLSPDCPPDCSPLDTHLPRIYERLGELYEQRGSAERAVYYYGRFVDLWETADPELEPRVEAPRRAIEVLSHPTAEGPGLSA